MKNEQVKIQGPLVSLFQDVPGAKTQPPQKLIPPEKVVIHGEPKLLLRSFKIILSF